MFAIVSSRLSIVIAFLREAICVAIINYPATTALPRAIAIFRPQIRGRLEIVEYELVRTLTDKRGSGVCTVGTGVFARKLIVWPDGTVSFAISKLFQRLENWVWM